MGRKLRIYAITPDAIKSAGCEKYSDMKVALYFLRGMQRMGRLTDSDETALDRIDHPINQDLVTFRVIDVRHPEITGGDVIDSELLQDTDACQVLNEGRPDGITAVQRKVIVP